MLAMKVTALQSGMLNELIILDTKFDMVSTVKKAAEASGTYKKT